jgi:hypothetical protein
MAFANNKQVYTTTQQRLVSEEVDRLYRGVATKSIRLGLLRRTAG